MNNATITAADFLKKTYAQPLMRVVDIEEESLICQSDKDRTPFRVRGNNFEEEEDW